MVTLADVRAAADRIRAHVICSPLERSDGLSELCGVDVWLKLECFQPSGSFKLRGALNALLLLDETDRQAGVVAASAGNHGLGVARAAAILGMRATVVVPETASSAKVAALSQSGAELVQHGADYDAAEAYGLDLAARRGLHFVSPYNDPAVVAGGGTVGLEILEQLPRVRTVLVPVGGGGLIGGVGIAVHGVDPRIDVVGVQAAASPAMHVARRSGSLVHVDVLPTIADGLAGNIQPGSITLDLLLEHVREVVLIDEPAIGRAMRWLLENEHVLVEGSAAVGVAALQFNRPSLEGPVAVVLSGRNVSASVLRQYVLG